MTCAVSRMHNHNPPARRYSQNEAPLYRGHNAREVSIEMVTERSDLDGNVRTSHSNPYVKSVADFVLSASRSVVG